MQGIKINQVILNLGLENNPYTDKADIVELINTTILNTFSTSIQIEVGEYKGNEERTAVIYTSSLTDDIEQIINAVQVLCIVFNQEYIPFQLNNKEGVLVAHPNRDLQPIQFDSKYFIK